MKDFFFGEVFEFFTTLTKASWVTINVVLRPFSIQFDACVALLSYFHFTLVLSFMSRKISGKLT